MENFNFKEKYKIEDLLEIMKVLRGENGCPWDREQNHKTIRKNFIEETYEVIEAIDNDDTALLKEELGDVLLQVVFHSQMEDENGNFNFDEVCNDICQKLIIRHPHIFSDVKVENTNDVLSNWDKIKQQTKKQTAYYETLESVSKALPALMRAQKVCQRAQKAQKQIKKDYNIEGFADLNVCDCIEQIKKSLLQMENSLKTNNTCDEFGEILFKLSNLSQLMKIDSEELLYTSTDNFISNFTKREKYILLNK